MQHIVFCIGTKWVYAVVLTNSDRPAELSVGSSEQRKSELVAEFMQSISVGDKVSVNHNSNGVLCEIECDESDVADKSGFNDFLTQILTNPVAAMATISHK